MSDYGGGMRFRDLGPFFPARRHCMKVPIATLVLIGLAVSAPSLRAANPDEAAAAHNAQLEASFQQRKPQLVRDLPSFSVGALCLAYGDALRYGGHKDLGFSDDLLPMLRGEIKRRRITVIDPKVLEGDFAIGNSECHMYAALGEPDRSNRTVTARTVTTQHVYGNILVYTRNGVITAWQD